MFARRAWRSLCTTRPLLAGHSKWQNIRHDKAKNDARKLREAYAMATRITASVKSGGAEGNAQLATLIDKAKKMNITKKIIENAVKRGTGEAHGDGAALTDTMYEFMGPGGVAFIVEATTDNKTRTVSKVKHAMAKFNASLSLCAYLFQRKGEVVFAPKANETLDDVFEVALDIGAEDVMEYDDVDGEYNGERLFRVVTDPADLNSVSNELSKRGYVLRDSKTVFLAEPGTEVELPEDLEKLLNKCLTELDDIADVTSYHTNLK